MKDEIEILFFVGFVVFAVAEISIENRLDTIIRELKMTRRCIGTVWHSPADKPQNDKKLLVVVGWPAASHIEMAVHESDGWWSYPNYDKIDSTDVIAWGELPTMPDNK